MLALTIFILLGVVVFCAILALVAFDRSPTRRRLFQAHVRQTCLHRTWRPTAVVTTPTQEPPVTLVTTECVRCGTIEIQRRSGVWLLNQAGALVQAQVRG